MGDVLRLVRERRLDDVLLIRDWPIAPGRLGALVRLIDDATISGKIAKSVFEEMLQSNASPEEIVERSGLRQVTDEGAIAAAIEAVLADAADRVTEYRAGREKLFGFFVGQVMRATGGKANPQVVNQLLRARLQQK
jgi:aspartyl-tRNA(Asn)/glutamyl-tRNA(Gln) amidotransferase subunit B